MRRPPRSPAEVSLEGVLQVIADRLRPLVGATLRSAGHRGSRSAGSPGSSPAAWTMRPAIGIGALPQGHGILGLLITEQQSLRLDDVMSDPRRSRLPAGPSADALLPGRARGARGSSRRQPVPHGQDRRAPLHDGRPAAGGDVRAPGWRWPSTPRDSTTGWPRLALLQERERIGRDLHDGIIQALYAVGLSLEDVPELLALDRRRSRSADRPGHR